MNITAEKRNILQWIQEINDEKTIEKILNLKQKNEVSQFEKELIQKGLIDIIEGNTSTNDEVKKRFEAKFAKK